MLPVTSGFTAAVYGNEIRLQAKVVVENTEYTDEDIISITYEAAANNDEINFRVGSACCARVELELFSADVTAFDGKTHIVYVGTGDEWCKIGTFPVANASNIDDKRVRVLLYDAVRQTDPPINFDGSIFPITLGDFAAWVCSQTSVPLHSTTFTNSTYTIQTGFEANTTGRTLLKYIAQAAGCFVVANTDGEIEFKTYQPANNPLTLDRYFDPLTVGAYLSPSWDKLTVKVSEDDLGVTYGTGENVYAIVNNPVLYGLTADDEDTRQTVLSNILSNITGMAYRGITLQALGNPAIQVGDIINVTSPDNTVYSLPVMYNYWEYDGGMSQTLRSFATEPGDAVAVGEINQEIIALQLKSNEIFRDLDATRSTITNIETQLGQTETQVSELEQTVNGLSATITQSGGANLLRNSSAQFGDEYWDGPVQSATSIEIKAAYVAGTCFELQQGTIAQSIEVADGDYYVGFKYRKLLAAATITIEVNGVVTELDSSEYELVDLYNPLFVSGGVISVSITASDDGAGYIGDIMICKGGKQVWSPSPNETYSDNVQIGKGIQVDSNTVNTYTRIDADGNRIYNKATNAIVTEMTDKGILTEDITAQTATIDGFAFARVNGSLWIFDTQ